ncbi:MAG: alcohol dehydrogenase catalytic domain-containing protein [bacterium]|nr:alcohol dehydrogenase catalytic domain-containing protein [bacterium]
MKALVRFGTKPETLEFQEVPKPLVDETHAILRVEAVGICGRDLEHFREELDDKKVPFIPGHEFSGTIVELPPGAKNFKIGDRVTAETIDFVCGECEVCDLGNYNLCKKRKNIGGGMNGAYAPFMKVPLEYIHLLPDNVSFEEGAMVEPACVSYNATLINSNPKEGELVVIIGVGTVGLLCLQMATLRGAKVALIGLPEDVNRMKIGKDLGADYLIYANENPVEKVLELTKQNGAPLVIDTVGGSSKTMDQALEMVRPGGQITKVGWFMKTTNTTLDTLIRKNIRLQGSFSHTHEMWKECIDLISSGKVNAKKMISKVLPLEDWREGFELGFSRKALKVILKPN